MGGTTSSNARRITHSPKDGRTPVQELAVGYVALKENLEIYSIPSNNTGNTGPGGGGGGRNVPSATSRTKSITFSLKSLLTSSKQTGNMMTDSVTRDEDSRDSNVGAGGASRGGGVFMKLSRRMLNGRVSNSSSCSNQSTTGPESRLRQSDLIGSQRSGANGMIHYEDEGKGHVSMRTGQTIGQRRSDTSGGGFIGHGGGGGVGGYFGGRTSCVQPIDDNIVSVIAYTDKISPGATGKVHVARSNSVVDQRSSYQRRPEVIKNNSIVCDVIRNGYNIDHDVTYGVASENIKDRYTVFGVSHSVPRNNASATILNNKKNGSAVVGIRMEDSPLTAVTQGMCLPVEQCGKSLELVSCDSSSFTSFPYPILSQNKNNASFVGKNNNRVNIISQTAPPPSSSNNISHVQTSEPSREFYTNNNFLKNDKNLNNGQCGPQTTTMGSKKKVLRASTWELLLCLNEFIREHCVRLSRTDTQDAVVWLRQADRSLLASGWQDTTFINPANVVFLYLLVRDVLTLRGDEIDSAEDLRATLLVCLYLAYTYMGNEISYPLKPFLVAAATVTSGGVDSQGGQLSRGGARSSSAPVGPNNRAAAPPPAPPPVVDRQTRLKFWDRCLDLVERMSTQMLRINSDPIFFVETLKDLRSYSAEHIKDLV